MRDIKTVMCAVLLACGWFVVLEAGEVQRSDVALPIPLRVLKDPVLKVRLPGSTSVHELSLHTSVSPRSVLLDPRILHGNMRAYSVGNDMLVLRGVECGTMSLSLEDNVSVGVGQMKTVVLANFQQADVMEGLNVVNLDFVSPPPLIHPASSSISQSEEGALGLCEFQKEWFHGFWTLDEPVMMVDVGLGGDEDGIDALLPKSTDEYFRAMNHLERAMYMAEMYYDSKRTKRLMLAIASDSLVVDGVTMSDEDKGLDYRLAIKTQDFTDTGDLKIEVDQIRSAGDREIGRGRSMTVEVNKCWHGRIRMSFPGLDTKPGGKARMSVKRMARRLEGMVWRRLTAAESEALEDSGWQVIGKTDADRSSDE